MAWASVTADLASAGRGGWRLARADGTPALLFQRGVILDAEVEDAIFTLPSARENAGKVYWVKRVDDPGTTFVAEVVTVDSSETIQGASVYSLTSQWASVVLVAAADGTWLIQSEIV